MAADYLSKEDIPKEKTAEENGQWWNDLNKQEKADYTALYPASIGALDGLPSDVRDEANRAVLAENKGAYQLRLDSIPPKPTMYAQPGMSERVDQRDRAQKVQEWEEKHGGEFNRINGVLDGIAQIEERFSRTGQKGLPDAYLLGFDPTGEGDGRVILANGNPDTADRVATYVPGTFAGIESIGKGDDNSDIGRSERLWHESQRLATGESVSTITWLDYNAPDSIAPDATRGQAADQGGEALRRFQEGSAVAHQNATGRDAHTTVIGHSYGSTVVGEAGTSVNYDDDSWKGKPLADELIFVGSPGVQADRAADFGTSPENVWAMGSQAPDDFLVRQGGKLVGLGDDLTVPTDEDFGANVIKNDSDGHTAFWDEESQSLKNQASVIAGDYDHIDLE